MYAIWQAYQTLQASDPTAGPTDRPFIPFPSALFHTRGGVGLLVHAHISSTLERRLNSTGFHLFLSVSRPEVAFIAYSPILYANSP